ncbi:hypothetical protein ACO0LD_05385 [Undibacterium sp. Ji83W]|uniref:hypothetical protein n=1 Tax=Undibacterium sp. Ji83W TaxID=3413043 RepID=UPI003BF0C095
MSQEVIQAAEVRDAQVAKLKNIGVSISVSTRFQMLTAIGLGEITLGKTNPPPFGGEAHWRYHPDC